MNRNLQDFLTWLLGVVIVASQAIPGVPEKPYVLGVAATILGYPLIRRAQDGINKMNGKEER